ncbi:Uncharacterised protein [Vibrio cholerae]|nr:Uncharacterised protein [Vibrio cholerae]CSC03137.1 Uncharacterised protein [Vibrio cholerae]
MIKTNLHIGAQHLAGLIVGECFTIILQGIEWFHRSKFAQATHSNVFTIREMQIDTTQFGAIPDDGFNRLYFTVNAANHFKIKIGRYVTTERKRRGRQTLISVLNQ